MTMSGKGPHHVVLWGGDSSGKELTLIANDAGGKRFATVTKVGLEGGRPVDPVDRDHLWFIKYEIAAPAAGTGTLTAVDKSGMPFARIQLIVSSGAAKKAVILIPTQGKDVISFKSVAFELNKTVYGGKAIIAQSTVLPGNDFKITSGGKAFDITSKLNLSTFIIVSHCSFDGPNLAFKSEDKSLGEHQVLRVDPPAASQKAVDFWTETGKALNGDGKVILLGCHSAVFAPRITPLLGRRVFGLRGDCPAADINFSVPHVAAIESGGRKTPMELHGPPAA